MVLKSIAVAGLIVLAQAAGCDPTPAVVSDYCSRYQRQVLTQAEQKQIMSLMPQLRRRIQGNEVDYLCNCTGWSHPICRKAQQQR